MNPESLTATPAEQFLAQLRSETAASHKNLENLPVSASLLSPAVDKDQYAHYLTLMHDVVADTEHTIFPLLASVVPDLSTRAKKTVIESDLTHLGLAKPSHKKVFADYFSTNTGTGLAPEKISESFALGVLYVVEGSSLGGRFILNHISTTIGFDENGGARYFAGYGNKTGQMWKNFLQNLTRYQAENKAGDEIIAGADFAFRAIHEHFFVHS